MESLVPVEDQGALQITEVGQIWYFLSVQHRKTPAGLNDLNRTVNLRVVLLQPGVGW